MKFAKLVLSGVLLLFGTATAAAAARVLVNGVHGNPEIYPFIGELNLEQFIEDFPEIDFHTVTADDLPVCRVLMEGIYAPGNHSFTVPEAESDLLTCLYVKFDTGAEEMQCPYDLLTDPAQTQYLPFENSIIVENPLPGQWSLYLEAFPDPGDRWLQIGLGPSLFDILPLDAFDLHLLLPNFALSLFRGLPPQFNDGETAALNDYFTLGGGLVIARQSGSIVEKPVVQIYDLTADWRWQVDFPGRLLWGETLQTVPNGSRRSLFQLNLTQAAQATILYEGLLGEPMRPLTCSRQGDDFVITNHGAGLLHPCLLIKRQPDDRVRVLAFPLLTPGGTAAAPERDLLLARCEWRDYMRSTMIAAETRYGMTPAEAASFEANWHWTERLDQALSGEWQGLYLYHTESYDQLIPLAGRAGAETIRLLWHFDSPLTTGKPAALPYPEPDPQPGIPCSVYHEYGFIWEHDFPEQLDQQYFAINFADVPLYDPTDYWLDEMMIEFHTFNSGSPLAAQLLEGISLLHGECATGIYGEGLEFPVTGDEDTQDGGEFFPPGSYPPVVALEYHEEGVVLGISDQGFLDDRADNHQFMLNLFEALDKPELGEENWLRFDPPVQEVFIGTVGRGDIEFMAVNLGRDTAVIVQEAPSVLWLETAGVTPSVLAPGDSALVEYNVLWDSPWLEDGEYDIELPLGPGSGAALVYAIVSLQEVKQLPQQLELVRARPNPFNNVTTLELQLNRASCFDLSVYNQLGQYLGPLSAQHRLPGGNSSLQLDFSGYASGVYFYRLRFTGGDVYNGSITLLR